MDLTPLAGASVAAAAAAVAALAALALAVYWLLAVTEGAYLGPRVVAWLYDRGAPSYDGVKRFVAHDEAAEIANPLVDRLETRGAGLGARTLDVATGTGRASLALLGLPHLAGHMVGIDLSRGMLREAHRNLAPWPERHHLVRASAVPLPFVDESFDAVVLLEALEFLPDRDRAVREVARVLTPGGWALLSNRRGIDRWLLPGRVDSAAAFERRLMAAGFVDVERAEWESYYDLFWGRKPGDALERAEAPEDWRVALRCPACGRSAWVWSVDIAECRACGRTVPCVDGVWDLAARLP